MNRIYIFYKESGVRVVVFPNGQTAFWSSSSLVSSVVFRFAFFSGGPLAIFFYNTANYCSCVRACMQLFAVAVADVAVAVLRAHPSFAFAFTLAFTFVGGCHLDLAQRGSSVSG